MKINYYGYYFKNIVSDEKLLFSITDLIKNFCKLESTKFKNNFFHSEEHLYLLHQTSDIYLFVITRSQEVIRRINTEDLSLGEVKTLLDQDEQLGFASYICIKDYYIAFGSTLLAPKSDVFGLFINDLLQHLGITEWKFCLEAVLHQATKDEIMKMPFIGRTTFSLNKENSFIKDLLNTITVTPEDSVELDSFEITIKPTKSKNIKKTVNKFLQKIPDEGIEKIVTKAKNEIRSNLVDLYVVGKGAISDNISNKDESKIASILEEKFSKNVILQEKINEYSKDEQFKKEVPNTLSQYNDYSTWNSFLSNIQSTNILEK